MVLVLDVRKSRMVTGPEYQNIGVSFGRLLLAPVAETEAD